MLGFSSSSLNGTLSTVTSSQQLDRYDSDYKSSPKVAIDANSEEQKKLYVTGGTIIAIGGLEVLVVVQVVALADIDNISFQFLCGLLASGEIFPNIFKKLARR